MDENEENKDATNQLTSQSMEEMKTSIQGSTGGPNQVDRTKGEHDDLLDTERIKLQKLFEQICIIFGDEQDNAVEDKTDRPVSVTEVQTHLRVVLETVDDFNQCREKESNENTTDIQTVFKNINAVWELIRVSDIQEICSARIRPSYGNKTLTNGSFPLGMLSVNSQQCRHRGPLHNTSDPKKRVALLVVCELDEPISLPEYAEMVYESVTLTTFLTTTTNDLHDYHLYIGVPCVPAQNNSAQRSYQKLRENGVGVNITIVPFETSPSAMAPSEKWNQLFSVSLLTHDMQFDYFYQCHDGTTFLRNGWVDECINSLSALGDIGVVGQHDSSSNSQVLTQCFVSRIHYDIFGVFFPPEITDDLIYTWISYTYLERCVRFTEHFHCASKNIVATVGEGDSSGTTAALTRTLAMKWITEVSRWTGLTLEERNNKCREPNAVMVTKLGDVPQTIGASRKEDFIAGVSVGMPIDPRKVALMGVLSTRKPTPKTASLLQAELKPIPGLEHEPAVVLLQDHPQLPSNTSSTSKDNQTEPSTKLQKSASGVGKPLYSGLYTARSDPITKPAKDLTTSPSTTSNKVRTKVNTPKTPSTAQSIYTSMETACEKEDLSSSVVVWVARCYQLGHSHDHPIGQARGGVAHVVRSACRQKLLNAHLHVVILWNGVPDLFLSATRQAEHVYAQEYNQNSPGRDQVHFTLYDTSEVVCAELPSEDQEQRGNGNTSQPRCYLSLPLNQKLATLYNYGFLVFERDYPRANLWANFDASDICSQYDVSVRIIAGAREAASKLHGKPFYLINACDVWFDESNGRWVWLKRSAHCPNVSQSDHKSTKGRESHAVATVSSTLVLPAEVVLSIVNQGMGSHPKYDQDGKASCEDLWLREVLNLQGVIGVLIGVPGDRTQLLKSLGRSNAINQDSSHKNKLKVTADGGILASVLMGVWHANRTAGCSGDTWPLQSVTRFLEGQTVKASDLPSAFKLVDPPEEISDCDARNNSLPALFQSTIHLTSKLPFAAGTRQQCVPDPSAAYLPIKKPSRQNPPDIVVTICHNVAKEITIHQQSMKWTKEIILLVRQMLYPLDRLFTKTTRWLKSLNQQRILTGSNTDGSSARSSIEGHANYQSQQTLISLLNDMIRCKGANKTADSTKKYVLAVVVFRVDNTVDPPSPPTNNVKTNKLGMQDRNGVKRKKTSTSTANSTPKLTGIRGFVVLLGYDKNSNLRSIPSDPKAEPVLIKTSMTPLFAMTKGDTYFALNSHLRNKDKHKRLAKKDEVTPGELRNRFCQVLTNSNAFVAAEAPYHSTDSSRSNAPDCFRTVWGCITDATSLRDKCLAVELTKQNVLNGLRGNSTDQLHTQNALQSAIEYEPCSPSVVFTPRTKNDSPYYTGNKLLGVPTKAKIIAGYWSCVFCRHQNKSFRVLCGKCWATETGIPSKRVHYRWGEIHMPSIALIIANLNDIASQMKSKAVKAMVVTSTQLQCHPRARLLSSRSSKPPTAAVLTKGSTERLIINPHAMHEIAERDVFVNDLYHLTHASGDPDMRSFANRLLYGGFSRPKFRMLALSFDHEKNSLLCKPLLSLLPGDDKKETTTISKSSEVEDDGNWHTKRGRNLYTSNSGQEPSGCPISITNTMAEQLMGLQKQQDCDEDDEVRISDSNPVSVLNNLDEIPRKDSPHDRRASNACRKRQTRKKRERVDIQGDELKVLLRQFDHELWKQLMTHVSPSDNNTNLSEPNAWHSGAISDMSCGVDVGKQRLKLLDDCTSGNRTKVINYVSIVLRSFESTPSDQLQTFIDQVEIIRRLPSHSRLGGKRSYNHSKESCDPGVYEDTDQQLKLILADPVAPQGKTGSNKPPGCNVQEIIRARITPTVPQTEKELTEWLPKFVLLDQFCRGVPHTISVLNEVLFPALNGIALQCASVATDHSAPEQPSGQSSSEEVTIRDQTSNQDYRRANNLTRITLRHLKYASTWKPDTNNPSPTTASHRINGSALTISQWCDVAETFELAIETAGPGLEAARRGWNDTTEDAWKSTALRMHLHLSTFYAISTKKNMPTLVTFLLSQVIRLAKLTVEGLDEDSNCTPYTQQNSSAITSGRLPSELQSCISVSNVDMDSLVTNDGPHEPQLFPTWLAKGDPVCLVKGAAGVVYCLKINIDSTTATSPNLNRVFPIIRWVLAQWWKFTSKPSDTSTSVIPSAISPSSDSKTTKFNNARLLLSDGKADNSKKNLESHITILVDMLGKGVPELVSAKKSTKRGRMSGTSQHTTNESSTSGVDMKSTILVHFPECNRDTLKVGAKKRMAELLTSAPPLTTKVQTRNETITVSVSSAANNQKLEFTFPVGPDEKIFIEGVVSHCGPTVHVVGCPTGNGSGSRQHAKLVLQFVDVFTLLTTTTDSLYEWSKRPIASFSNPQPEVADSGTADEEGLKWHKDKAASSLTAITAGFQWKLLLDHRIKTSTAEGCECKKACMTKRCPCISRGVSCQADKCHHGNGNCMNTAGKSLTQTQQSTLDDKKQSGLSQSAEEEFIESLNQRTNTPQYNNGTSSSHLGDTEKQESVLMDGAEQQSAWKALKHTTAPESMFKSAHSLDPIGLFNDVVFRIFGLYNGLQVRVNYEPLPTSGNRETPASSEKALVTDDDTRGNLAVDVNVDDSREALPYVTPPLSNLAQPAQVSTPRAALSGKDPSLAPREDENRDLHVGCTDYTQDDSVKGGNSAATKSKPDHPKSGKGKESALSQKNSKASPKRSTRRRKPSAKRQANEKDDEVEKKGGKAKASKAPNSTSTKRKKPDGGGKEEKDGEAPKKKKKAKVTKQPCTKGKVPLSRCTVGYLMRGQDTTSQPNTPNSRPDFSSHQWNLQKPLINGKIKGHMTRIAAGYTNSSIYNLGSQSSSTMVWSATNKDVIGRNGSSYHFRLDVDDVSLIDTEGRVWKSDEDCTRSNSDHPNSTTGSSNIRRPTQGTTFKDIAFGNNANQLGLPQEVKMHRPYRKSVSTGVQDEDYGLELMGGMLKWAGTTHQRQPSASTNCSNLLVIIPIQERKPRMHYTKLNGCPLQNVSKNDPVTKFGMKKPDSDLENSDLSNYVEMCDHQQHTSQLDDHQLDVPNLGMADIGAKHVTALPKSQETDTIPHSNDDGQIYSSSSKPPSTNSKVLRRNANEVEKIEAKKEHTPSYCRRKLVHSDIATMWSGATHLDWKRMGTSVFVTMPDLDSFPENKKPTSDFCGSGSKKQVLTVDPGLNTYATINCANTGAIYEIGVDAHSIIQRRFDEPVKAVQRELSEIVNKQPAVIKSREDLSAADNLNTISLARNTYYAAIRESWKNLSGSTNTDMKFSQLQMDQTTLLSRKKKYIDGLIKTTSKFLSSVGKDGIVLLPTNLMDQKKKGRMNNDFNR